MSRPGVSTATSSATSPNHQLYQQQPSSAPANPSSTASGFLGRHFGRRPKTAHSYSQDSGLLVAPAAQPRNSTSSSSASNNSTTPRFPLPRSSSSSHAFPAAASSDAISRPSSERPTHTGTAASRLRPATANDLGATRSFLSTDPHPSSSRASPSSMVSGSAADSGATASRNAGSGYTSGGGTSGGGNPFGRMFRRYSQGASRFESQSQAQAQAQALVGRDGSANTGQASHSHRSSSSHVEQQQQQQQRGRSTPPRSSRHASPSPAMPQSASYNSLVLPNHESPGSLTNSRTLAVLSDPAPAHANGSPVTEGAAAASSGGASAAAIDTAPAEATAAAAAAAAAAATGSGSSSSPAPNVHRIRLVPHLEATRSLHFEPIERDLGEGKTPVKVGRFTDRQPPASANATVAVADPGAPSPSAITGAGAGSGAGSEQPSYSAIGQPGARGGAITVSSGQGGGVGGVRIDSSRVAFKSKVVSRGHAEIWCEPGGRFFIKDTKSSSGTFLNHIRLSAPNVESRPFAIKDGDVIQLGVDYQGGTEEIYRCVKMRVELNRGWQREANQFNVNALRQLRALQGTPLHTPSGGAAGGKDRDRDAELLPTNRQGVSVTDCCICLFSVTVCQALFIAPCSHVFHYKCIRPLLTLHHPGFSCPLCRTFADLEADVEEDEAWQEALLKEAAAAESRAAEGQPAVDVATPRAEVDAPIALAATLEATTLSSGGSSAGAAAASSSSPIPARLTGSGMGRGTAVSALRRAEWARPDTAVGSSVGPLPDYAATAEASGQARITDAQEEAVVGQMLDEDHPSMSPLRPQGDDDDDDERHGRAGRDQQLDDGDDVDVDDGDGDSPANDPARAALRRGSVEPIAIGSGRGAHHGRDRGSAEHSSDSAYAAAANRLGTTQPSTPPSIPVGQGSGFALAAGAMSPGLADARTPLNNTFLSTLAEAPSASALGRDFHAGRTAPADRQMPIQQQQQRSSGEADADGSGSGSGGRLSEGGDETETADNPLDARSRAAARGSGELGEGMPVSIFGRKGAALRDGGKGRAREGTDSDEASPDGAVVDGRLDHQQHEGRAPNMSSPSASKDSEPERDQAWRRRSRSRSRNRSGNGNAPADAGSSSPTSIPSPGLRTGPNINASAYMHGHQHPRGAGGSGGGNGGHHSQQHHHHHHERSPPAPHQGRSAGTTTTGTGSGSGSASAISKFKKKFSGAA
ncbi:uncharacterized protein PFL1_06608 [Pseudozyma flocculosa PF-1]|uniref:FHA domain-containing protein n=1 Tax=Pseudozyma flocculosa PF-1 TaxID=1277687 RepID=A0A061H1F0_9BASI|nr:uncharacterized protein PFL1_06608 [Pseudozyma flocculosa PF-1]EPQ25934.1 hypothetical protein PFL1_06608 [Pseudozyma flocculosa PF-1]